jgi:N-acetylglutamate synthase-like GNAT family acetyltransferase
MFSIRFADIGDISSIQEIAGVTWPNTYVGIISSEQIEYMLGWMYSTEKIKASIEDPDQAFLIIELDDKMVGFAGIEHRYSEKPITRIHKLYVLPETQGTGAGKALFEAVVTQALLNDSEILHLNVNKANKAVSFYEYLGFSIYDTEILDIGNGYVMDDYIMTKKITH